MFNADTAEPAEVIARMVPVFREFCVNVIFLHRI